MSDLSRVMEEASEFLDRKKDSVKGSDVQKNPALVIAYGVALASLLLVAGYSTRWVIPALGAGFGIATSIISKGIASSDAYSAWVIPAGAAGIVSIGGVAVVILLMSIVKRAMSQPYLSVLPLLAVLAGFCVDLCKDFYPNLPVARVGFGALTSAVLVMGGLWWRRYGLLNKVAGAILMITPPFIILAHTLSRAGDHGLSSGMDHMAGQSWLAISGLVAILIVTGLLAFTVRNEMHQ